MVSLREAKVTDPEARKVLVDLLTVGKGNPRDRHYYTQTAIDTGASAFEGKPAFADHSSVSEESDRPERSVRDIIGYYEDVHADGASLKATLRVLPGPAFDWAWSLVQESIAFAQKHPGQNLAGISICARGETAPGQHDGEDWKDVTRILEAKSADVVTLPARGGRFIQLTEDEGGSMKLGEILQALKSKAAEIEAAAGDKVPMLKDLTRMVDQAASMQTEAEGTEGQLIHLPDAGELPVIPQAAAEADGEAPEAKAAREAEDQAYKSNAMKQAAERYAKAAEGCTQQAEAEQDPTKKAEFTQRAGEFKRMADRYATAADPAGVVPPVPGEKPAEPVATSDTTVDPNAAKPAAPVVPPVEDKVPAQVESLRQEKDDLESRLVLREANIPAGLVDLMLPAMKGKSADDKRAFVEAKRQELGTSLLEAVRVRFNNGARTVAAKGVTGSNLLRQQGLIQ
jgi:hypothetical protein